ncbi:hypothetical protein M0R88_01575 [Halorussus gelatinilyticus]|uniref:Uncharacterized protein n=1 Tax=Halorussus gelatinilyticus TaxID=2937524 RepID=A0A8U0II80_9EURY|nr:hypothetical protein [Halorussus gelatinilyticus]UPW00807.1 hypothetical protein M0R88_01575 [Halorussus gelatinilyticus]
MKRLLLALALVAISTVAGCSALPLDTGPRYDVSVETVAASDSEIRVIAISPREGETLPKGAAVTVDGGYVSFTEMATMPYDETAYLTYVPSRTKFDLTERVRPTDRGLDAANFSVGEVRISAGGYTGTYDV